MYNTQSACTSLNVKKNKFKQNKNKHIKIVHIFLFYVNLYFFYLKKTTYQFGNFTLSFTPFGACMLYEYN
jgi:hypothetical protein